MACTLIALNSGICVSTDGGITSAAVTSLENISGVTYDVNGIISNFTMLTAGKWASFIPDTDSDTAFFNQTGERQGTKHNFKQELHMRFIGLTNDYKKSAQSAADCCQLVVVIFTNSGNAMVQGIEQVGSSLTSYLLSKKPCKATVNLLTDTGANEERVELNFMSTSRRAASFTTLTAAQLAAL